MAALALLEGDLDAITQVCLKKAKAGDLVACKLILDKLIPNRREQHITLELPKLTDATGVPQALSAILEAMAQGQITPGEGQCLAALLETYWKSVTVSDLQDRVSALEQQAKKMTHPHGR